MWRGRSIEDDELAICSEGGCRDEGLAEENADIGDEIPGGRMICTVQYKVILADNGLCVFGGEMASVGDVFGQGVQSVNTTCESSGRV